MGTHITQLSTDILHDIEDAIIHDAHTGFKIDYLCVHSLIRRHRPNSFLEIGSNIGAGLNVICNAIYKYNFESKIYSLDLPYETMRQNSKQYPIGEHGEDRVGSAARFPFIQLRGDSLTFDFSKYQVEGFYCDGEHDEIHAGMETAKMLAQNPKIIIYHDSDIDGVWKGITKHLPNDNYDLYRVTDTRIAYALRK